LKIKESLLLNVAKALNFNMHSYRQLPACSTGWKISEIRSWKYFRWLQPTGQAHKKETGFSPIKVAKASL
jgi:hypothetical protein